MQERVQRSESVSGHGSTSLGLWKAFLLELRRDACMHACVYDIYDVLPGEGAERGAGGGIMMTLSVEPNPGFMLECDILPVTLCGVRMLGF